MKLKKSEARAKGGCTASEKKNGFRGNYFSDIMFLNV
jgi:hypothetical protein